MKARIIIEAGKTVTIIEEKEQGGSLEEVEDGSIDDASTGRWRPS